jgi:hypothetical protein
MRTPEASPRETRRGSRIHAGYMQDTCKSNQGYMRDKCINVCWLLLVRFSSAVFLSLVLSRACVLSDVEIYIMYLQWFV